MAKAALVALGWSGLLVLGGAGLAHAAREGLPALAAVCVGLLVVAALARSRAAVPGVANEELFSQKDWWSLNAERHQLALLVEQVPTPLLIVDSAHRLIAKNRAARTVFGTDHELAHPPQALVQAIDSIVPPRTITLPTPTGARTFLVQATALVQQGERIRLIVLTDIQSGLHENEAHILRNMLKILEHEIRNGVAPVASLAETTRVLLNAGDAASLAKARDAVATICRRSESVLTFADEFRAMSSLPVPQLAECRLSEVAMDLKLLFDTRWAPDGVLLTLHAATDVIIRADHNQLVQALWALTENAAEATLVNPIGDRHIRVSYGRVGDGVRIQIDDNGPGFGRISPEQAFLPFVSGKPAGSGIGLSLARQICRGHGGDINVASAESERGSSLVVRL